MVFLNTTLTSFSHDSHGPPHAASPAPSSPRQRRTGGAVLPSACHTVVMPAAAAASEAPAASARRCWRPSAAQYTAEPSEANRHEGSTTSPAAVLPVDASILWRRVGDRPRSISSGIVATSWQSRIQTQSGCTRTLRRSSCRGPPASGRARHLADAILGCAGICASVEVQPYKARQTSRAQPSRGAVSLDPSTTASTASSHTHTCRVCVRVCVFVCVCVCVLCERVIYQ